LTALDAFDEAQEFYAQEGEVRGRRRRKKCVVCTYSYYYHHYYYYLQPLPSNL